MSSYTKIVFPQFQGRLSSEERCIEYLKLICWMERKVHVSILIFSILIILLGSCEKGPTKPDTQGQKCTVSGHVYYAGSTISVSGVMVKIDEVSSTTGSDGKYILKNILKGKHTITASKKDYDESSNTLDIESDTLFDIEMTSQRYTHSLEGTVFNLKGDAIYGVKVIILNPDSTSSKLIDTTDLTGHFQISSIPQGTRIIRFEFEGYYTKDEIILMADMDKTYNVQLHKLQHKISGIIYGADNVLVTLSGDDSDIKEVNRGDVYSFIVEHGGNYLVTPLKNGYNFTPPTKSFNNVISDKNQDFTALIAGKIAFGTNRDGNFEIYVMDSDGTKLINLTKNSAYDNDPSWSPDGSQIAFTTERDGNLEIYVMGADGSNPKRLTNHIGECGAPTWSPNGNKIAFHSFGDDDCNIFVIDIDGSNLTKLTYGHRETEPSWAPDGYRIAYTEDYESIFTIYSDGSNIKQISPEGYYWYRNPSFSPDGLYIVCEKRDPYDNKKNDISILDSYGGLIDTIISHPAQDLNPSWSPDNSYIVFNSDRDGNEDIFIFNINGQNTINLTNYPSKDQEPSWSPFK